MSFTLPMQRNCFNNLHFQLFWVSPYWQLDSQLLHDGNAFSPSTSPLNYVWQLLRVSQVRNESPSLLHSLPNLLDENAYCTFINIVLVQKISLLSPPPPPQWCLFRDMFNCENLSLLWDGHYFWDATLLLELHCKLVISARLGNASLVIDCFCFIY